MTNIITTTDRTPNLPANGLLRTKLFIPQARQIQDLLPRPRLVDRLQAGLVRKLTLIAAPAGYGKTVLLTEWIPQSDRCVCWLALDETDNDLARFFIYVIAALQTLKADFGQGTLVALQSSQPPAGETLIIALVNEITQTLPDFALVLDDYHLIHQPAIHSAVALFVNHLPPNMHLILASRADPPLPLARLRVRGQLTELRAADLRFTLDETSAFFQQMKALPLTPVQIQELATRTEGWGAGLHLAALSLQGLDAAAIARFIGDFTGSHSNVFDYLAEEVFHQQPADVQQFLLHTAILSRLCAPLCDAVLGKDEGGRLALRVIEGMKDEPVSSSFIPHPSSFTLEQLQHANLFLTPLDNRRHWFRYHHLFADFLRQRLTQAIGETGVNDLYRRARLWHEQHDLAEEAINYALAARDWPAAITLMQQLNTSLWSSARHLLKWLASLPQEEVEQSPDLCMWCANWLMLGGEFDRVAGLLETATRLSRSTGQPGKLSGIYAYHAMAAFLREDGQATIDHARQALAYLDDENRFLEPHVTEELARGYFLNGEPDTAERLWAETRALGQATNSPRILLFVRAAQGELQWLRGKRRQAAQLDMELLQLIGERPVDIIKIRALTRLARQQYEWNHLDQAEHYGRQALAVTGETPRAVFVRSAYLTLAQVYQARGEREAAAQALTRAQTLAQQLGGEHPLVEVNAALVRWWLAPPRYHASADAEAGRTAALAWAAAQPVDPAGTLPYASQLTNLALCRVFLAQGRPDQALPLLERLLAAAEATGRGGEMVEMLALQALAHQACDQPTQALAVITQALHLAEPEGYIRTFVDEGPPMAQLLSTLNAQPATVEMPAVKRAYVDTLLAAFPAVGGGVQAIPTPIPLIQRRVEILRTHKGNLATQNLKPDLSLANGSGSQKLIEPLSKRELEILHLLAQGLTNPEIAQQIYVSAQTVKVHTRNIYGKLGVNSRRQAVATARTLGLLV